MRARRPQAGVVPDGATVLEPVGTAPGCRWAAPAAGRRAARAAARAAAGCGGALEVAAARAAGARRSCSSGSCASSRCPSRRSPRPCASWTPPLPLEITTCLRDGELEIATGSRPSDAAAYDALEAALRSATATRCSPRRRDDRRGRRAAARRAHDRDRRVVHRRADGGPADRPRGLVRLRAGRARRVLERGQDRAGRRSRCVDRARTVPCHPRSRTALSAGARSRLDADIGIGITGIAGPGRRHAGEAGRHRLPLGQQRF